MLKKAVFCKSVTGLLFVKPSHHRRTVVLGHVAPDIRISRIYSKQKSIINS